MSRNVKIVSLIIILFVTVIIICGFIFFNNKDIENIDISKPLTQEEIILLLSKRNKNNNIHYTIYKKGEESDSIVIEIFKKGNKSVMKDTHTFDDYVLSMESWSNEKKSILVDHSSKSVNIYKINDTDYSYSLDNFNYEFVETTQINGRDTVVIRTEDDDCETLIYVDVETGVHVQEISTYEDGSVTEYYTVFEIGSVTNEDVKEIDYKKLYPDYTVYNFYE